MSTPGQPCTVVLHDDATSTRDVLCGAKLLPLGSIAYLTAPGAKTLCIENRANCLGEDEISLHISLARLFGFENRMRATVHVIDDVNSATATHVEILMRDQNLSRADMWKIQHQIDGSVLYRTQKLDYLGSSTISIEAIYIAGREVQSAPVAHPLTKLIFRSGSARFTILVQVSKEMLENWTGTDLMYERVVNGFLPELFRHWEDLKVRHQITLVLFGRGLDLSMGRPRDGETVEPPPSDFFHLIALDAAAIGWRSLVKKLKEAFATLHFPRQLSLASKGNLLEAVHFAAMDFVSGNDQHLSSTGTSIIVVTAGAGMFEADYEQLKSTTSLLIGSSIGVDIVSVAPKPLHPVPLLEYVLDDRTEFALPHWMDISFWTSEDDPVYSGWLDSSVKTTPDSVKISRLRKGESAETLFDNFDENTFGASIPVSSKSRHDTPHVEHVRRVSNSTIGSSTDRSVNSKPQKSGEPSDRKVSQPTKGPSTNNHQDHSKPSSLRHPLLQAGRKISLGVRGITPTQSVASTGVSTPHVQHDRDATSAFAMNESRSGLSKQIKESLRRKPSYQSIRSSAPLDPVLTSGQPVIESSNRTSMESAQSSAGLSEAPVLGRASSDTYSDAESGQIPIAVRPASIIHPNEMAVLDPRDSVTPWLTLLNPCNPRKENMRIAGEYRQWQNAFPRLVSSREFKWRSMCRPAALPLLKEVYPTKLELDTLFQKSTRQLNVSDKETSPSMQQIIWRMLDMRLNAGYQIVATSQNVRGQLPLGIEDKIIVSCGGNYHDIRRLSDSEVQVTEYDLQTGAKDPSAGHKAVTSRVRFKPVMIPREIRATLHPIIGSPPVDWATIDKHCLSGAEASHLGQCRLRLVLIPFATGRGEKQALTGAKELSEDERRLEGINKLTQMWQRHRYFSDENQRHQVSMVKAKSTGSVERDPNPLAIEYLTRDPSTVVGAYGLDWTKLGEGEALTKLFSESEKYHTSNFDVAKLVKHMQDAPPDGVEFKDRRWFTRMHLNCFRGDEMTNWLLRVFDDLQLREDAVALGNELMERDIFTHVRGRHEFRDGNYFYQIKAAHRTTDYPDTAGLFGRPSGRSPTNPDPKQSPSTRPVRADSDSTRDVLTPVLAPMGSKEKKVVLLSQKLQYNADPGQKSSKLEILNVHYDRVHNSENCYNMLLEWDNTTSKLIRDAVMRWAGLVEVHGLRLVQLPQTEASRLRENHPFEQPISIRLAAYPPEKKPMTPQLDSLSSSPRAVEDPEGFHKAILRHLDFVLDVEAAHSFPNTVEVSFSWGKPDYRFTQFIHKSGLMLAQIVNDGSRDFLLLPNRLASNLTTGTSKRMELPSLESIVQKVLAFCRSAKDLKALYEEQGKSKTVAPSPFVSAAPTDHDVPPIELPPRLTHRSLLRNAG